MIFGQVVASAEVPGPTTAARPAHSAELPIGEGTVAVVVRHRRHIAWCAEHGDVAGPVLEQAQTYPTGRRQGCLGARCLGQRRYIAYSSGGHRLPVDAAPLLYLLIAQGAPQ
ncbi:hypothetical protein M444_02810 [Streptomyces sp. Mg1]|nr:hypothetical protein M444_02810 [Streptomyces sp. Mg1]